MMNLATRRLGVVVAVVALMLVVGWALASGPSMLSTIGGQINVDVDRSFMPEDVINGSGDTTCTSPNSDGECGPGSEP